MNQKEINQKRAGERSSPVQMSGISQRGEKYKFSASERQDVVEIVLEGEITTGTINKLMGAIRELVESMNPKKLLVDARALKGRFGYTAAYFRVRDYPSSFYKIKIALVDIAENTDYQSFHEYIAVNSGFLLKWFVDIRAARHWLRDN